MDTTALSVVCPTCAAGPGDACFSASTKQPCDPHKDRAATAGLPPAAAAAGRNLEGPTGAEEAGVPPRPA